MSSKANKRQDVPMKSAQAGSWHWNVVKNIIYWDEAMNDLLGLKVKTYISNYERFARLIHDEDRLSVKEKMGKCVSTPANFSFNFRIVKPNGAIHLINARGATYFNEIEEPLNVSGICVDITEQLA